MEILTSNTVMAIAWWFVVAVGVIVIGTIIALVAASDDHNIVTLIFTLIVLAGIVVFFVAPHEIPTDKMSYTVEITDNTLFQSLINKGYTFTRLFENKDIYTIVGDVLK